MSENSYIIEPNGAESARLLDQDSLFTEAVGALFPTEIDISQVTTLLNLACGPGGWDRAVGFNYPGMSVVGIDIDPDVIEYAKAFASLGSHENVTFEVMDVKQSFGFPDNSFDLVNGRLMSGFLDRQTWPVLLKECLRVLKPGGIILLTEYEMSISSSSSLQCLLHYLYQALKQQQRTYSIDGHSIGICHVLGKLLKEAAFIAGASKPFQIDTSYDSPHSFSGLRNTEVMFTLIKPYLLKTGIVGRTVYDALLHQMQVEMRDAHFVNVSFGLQCWGYKPEGTK